MGQLVGTQGHEAWLGSTTHPGGLMGQGSPLHPRPQLQMEREWGSNRECPAQPTLIAYAHHTIMGLGCLNPVLQSPEAQRGEGLPWAPSRAMMAA